MTNSNRLDIRPGQFFRSMYRDFEGMANGKEVLAKCRDPLGTSIGPTYKDGVIIDPTVTQITPPGQYAWDMIWALGDSPELRAAVRTITLNLVYERADGRDLDDITFDDVFDIAYVVREMLVCPQWVNVTDDDIALLENAPDDEGSK